MRSITTVRRLRAAALACLLVALTLPASASALVTSTFSAAAGPGAVPVSPATLGSATTYPSTVSVSGLPASISSLSVTLTGVSHTWPDDFDILLVGPQGQKVVLMSDACGGGDVPASGQPAIDLTFADSAAAMLPDTVTTPACTGGSFKPSHYADGDPLPAPAPALPYAFTLSAFNGTDPNGDWNLYVTDDASIDVGAVSSWSLTVTTPSASIPASGTASPYPLRQTIANRTGTIADVNASLEGFTHPFPDDVDVLVVSPQGTRVVLMSDACGSGSITSQTLTFDDEAAGTAPDGAPGCGTGGIFRPSDFESPETFPGPAPAGPYATALSAFDGEVPNGVWSFYVNDDLNPTGGEIGGVSLTFAVNPSEITIPGTPSPATPYPATRAVSIGRPVTDVDVTLKRGSHTYLDDLDVLLKGPTGATVELMSDACGGLDLVGADLIFDDEAPGSLPDAAPGDLTNCFGVPHRPTSFEPGDVYPAPAPAGPYAGQLSAFDGTSPDGEWQLFVSDDLSGDGGFFATGFDVDVQTRPGGPVSLGEATVTATEGQSLALTLTRGVLPPGLLSGSVTVATSAAGAQAGSDFTALSQVVEFAAGETSKSVQVPVLANAAGEPAETFMVTLSDPARDAALGATATATVTIPADPPAPPPPAAPKPPGARPAGRGIDVISVDGVLTLPSAKKCVKPRSVLKLRARRRKGQTVTRVIVLVNGKRVARRSGRNLFKAFTIKRLPSKPYTVTVKVKTKSGKTYTAKRRYKVCK